jgi:hypothetical protein
MHLFARKEKRKIMPVHGTGMNVSPLSKCLTQRAVLLHEDLFMPLWEVGFVNLFLVPFI